MTARQTKKYRFIRVLVLLVALPLFLALLPNPLTPAADAYPVKPVRVIIPFAPGGGTDIVGRMIATKLSERLGMQFVVENRSGAGGTLGMEVVSKSAPDGYTLLFHSTGFITAPFLYKLDYDPMKSFAPVALLGISPAVLAVHPSVAANSVKDLVDLAKKQPGKLLNANAGTGAFLHLSSELFQMMSGADFRTIQFRSGGLAMTDVIGGHSHIIFASETLLMPHVKAGRLKALGYGWSARSKLMPELPTIAEAGVPGYEAAIMFGLFALAGTPPDIVDKLSRTVIEICKMEDVINTFATQAIMPRLLGPADFRKFLETEAAKWKKVIETRKIKAED